MQTANTIESILKRDVVLWDKGLITKYWCWLKLEPFRFLLNIITGMLAPEKENSRVHCVISSEKDLEDSKNFLISSIGANFTRY